MKILFPISIIIISIAIFFVVINPIFNNIKLLRTDISTYNDALSNSTNLQKRRNSLLERYRNISQNNKNRLNNLLPNTMNNIRFILEIEKIANSHSMPLTDIKFTDKHNTNSNNIVSSNISNSKPYGIFPVNFTTEGDYNSFILFLRDVEHNLRIMDINSISFTIPNYTAKIGDGINSNIYTYKLSIQTYWLK